MVELMLQGPTCAVCGHEVEAMDSERDVLRGVHRFTVTCHGETETVDVTDADVAAAKAGTLRFGLAFDSRRLPAPMRLLVTGEP